MTTQAGVLPHLWVSGRCVGESRSGAGLEAVISVSLRPLISQEVCHDESALRPSQEVKSNQGIVQVRRRMFERKFRLSSRQKSFNLKQLPREEEAGPLPATTFPFPLQQLLPAKKLSWIQTAKFFLSWEKH